MDWKSNTEVEAQHQFKDGKFTLSMSVENGEVLKLQIEDEVSGDQWIGRYNANYIEQLTHKTGNFKEFNIFCSMLESGLNKTSESIMLELMAYTDLESLRNEKNGAKQKKTSSTKFHNRRYLIMTYTVEFDRIHYPLSLHYVGKMDLSSLKELVRKQRNEITELKWKLQSVLKSSKVQDQQDLSTDRLLHENETLLSELEACKRALSNRDVAKELRILKKVIQSLESDLLKEKNRNQRMILKKTDECKQLADELENVKSSERNLRVRVKNLTEEISILKRSGHISPNTKFHSDRWLRKPEKLAKKVKRRSASMERRYTTPSPSGSKRFDPTAYIEEKKRKQHEVEKSKQRNKPSSSYLNRRSRSNSLDHQILVNASQSRDRPASLKHRRSSSRGTFRHSRNSSATSIGSRQSSADSGSERGVSKKSNRNPQSRDSLGSRILSEKRSQKSVIRSLLSSGESDVEGLISRKTIASNSKEKGRKIRNQWASHEKRSYLKSGSGDENEMENSLDIAEIDARLTALQKFMKSNMDDL